MHGPPRSALDEAMTGSRRTLTMLQDFLPFIVIGIATGSVYGLAGHRAGPHLQDVGDLQLRLRRRWPPSPSSSSTSCTPSTGWPGPWRRRSACSCSAPLEGLVLEFLARSLEPVGDTLKVVATVGLLLMVLAIGELWYGNISSTTVPQFLPQESTPHRRGPRELGPDHRGRSSRCWPAARPVLLLPLRAAGRRHARRGGQPRSGVDDRGEPGPGAALGLDHRHGVRLHGRPAARPLPQPRCPRHHDARGAGLRGRGHRVLLEPSAHLPRGSSSGWPGPSSTKYAVSISWLSGFPAEPPVHRPLRGAGRHPEGAVGPTSRRPQPACPEVVLCTGAGPAGLRRRGGPRARLRAEPGRHQPVHMVERPRRRDPLPLARAAGPERRARSRCATWRSPR